MYPGIFQHQLANYEKLQVVAVLLISVLLFSYGLWALIFGVCHLAGNGNPPFGTVVTFHGLQARLLSTIFIGGSIAFLSFGFLNKLSRRFVVNRLNNTISWLGVLLLVFGMCCLVVILSLPVFK